VIHRGSAIRTPDKRSPCHTEVSDGETRSANVGIARDG